MKADIHLLPVTWKLIFIYFQLIESWYSTDLLEADIYFKTDILLICSKADIQLIDLKADLTMIYSKANILLLHLKTDIILICSKANILQMYLKADILLTYLKADIEQIASLKSC